MSDDDGKYTPGDAILKQLGVFDKSISQILKTHDNFFRKSKGSKKYI